MPGHSPKLALLVFSLLLLAGSKVLAQAEYRFDHMTAEQGFPQSIVYRLAQDTVGNLWVTTEEGVVRFNSIETHNYIPGKGLPADFGESVRIVHVGRSGSIWMWRKTARKVLTSPT